MPRYTYGPLPLFTAGGNGLPDVVLENEAGGIFSATLNGPGITVYDFNDQPIPSISSGPSGQAQWRVDDVLVGWVRFGDVSVRVMSNDAGDLLQNTQAAVDQANAARVAAELALAQVQDALANGGTGTGGGLPAGTTLEDIPNGATRLAMTTAERTRLQALPTTFLQLGATAATAKPGNYVPNIADINGVRNAGSAPAIVCRTVSQGVPTAAECAALGYPSGTLITVDNA